MESRNLALFVILCSIASGSHAPVQAAPRVAQIREIAIIVKKAVISLFSRKCDPILKALENLKTIKPTDRKTKAILKKLQWSLEELIDKLIKAKKFDVRTQKKEATTHLLEAFATLGKQILTLSQKIKDIGSPEAIEVAAMVTKMPGEIDAAYKKMGVFKRLMFGKKMICDGFPCGGVY